MDSPSYTEFEIYLKETKLHYFRAIVIYMKAKSFPYRFFTVCFFHTRSCVEY